MIHLVSNKTGYENGFDWFRDLLDRDANKKTKEVKFVFNMSPTFIPNVA